MSFQDNSHDDGPTGDVTEDEILHSFSHSISSKLELRKKPDKGGFGVYAAAPVRKGEVLVVWGGKVVSALELEKASRIQKRHSIQVDEGYFLIPHDRSEIGDFVNHSCDPNCGIKGQVSLVAMRNILPGEEICYDYAMTDASDYDEFECACGSDTCRGKVAGTDWMNEFIQKKYEQYFSAYIRQKIRSHRKSSYYRKRNNMVMVSNG